MADEVEEAAGHGVQHVEFVDSTFNIPSGHAIAGCEEIAHRRLQLKLSATGLNPAGVTVDLVTLMRRAGFHSVMCTPESASETTLATLQKGFDKETIATAARALLLLGNWILIARKLDFKRRTRRLSSEERQGLTIGAAPGLGFSYFAYQTTQFNLSPLARVAGFLGGSLILAAITLRGHPTTNQLRRFIPFD